MAGAFGYGADTQDASRAMAEAGLLPAIRAAGAQDIIVADGTSCRHQIADLAGRPAVHSSAGDQPGVASPRHSREWIVRTQRPTAQNAANSASERQTPPTWPLLRSAHPQSPAYGLAPRAASTIRPANRATPTVTGKIRGS